MHKIYIPYCSAKKPAEPFRCKLSFAEQRSGIHMHFNVTSLVVVPVYVVRP